MSERETQMLICDNCGRDDLTDAHAVRTRLLCDECVAKAKAAEPEVCNFCSTPYPEWGYPASTFVAPHFADETFESVMVDDWAACEACYTLIQADDHAALLRRSLRMAPGGDISADPFMRQVLKGLHAQFFANRQGTPYRHVKPDQIGCWVDGHWGQFAMTRVITIAEDHGWVLDDDGLELAKAWIRGDVDADLDAVVSLSDEAENWLNDKVAPHGFCFGWLDGEFFLQPESWWEENADA